MLPNPICSVMGSVVGTSGISPDSAEESEDMSQEGEDVGEWETMGMGKAGEE